MRVTVTGFLAMALPLMGVALWLGWQSTPARLGTFFGQTAFVTFGGAYAILPYVAQQAVERYGWLSSGQMMSGLALAETTPGPLIMVLQFVGFMAGWQHPGDLPPWMAATLGAAMTTWATFVPSFVFVFLGGPHVEQLRARPALAAVMTVVTAAVVGVMMNLAIWFSWHALWPSGWGAGHWLGGIDWFVAVFSAAALLALQRRWLGEMAIIGLGAMGGLGWR